MRDPQARIEVQNKSVNRYLFASLSNDHPLRGTAIKSFIDDRLLIPFDWNGSLKIESPRIPFVSSPEEWCDLQLYDAGILTLTILEKANSLHIDLKDASAWNIIFNGCRPIFCDITSFEKLSTHHWWPSGQFVKHFISPLWLSRYTGIHARNFFRMSRDGASPDIVRATLGFRRFFNRCWPLVINPKLNNIYFSSPPIATENTTRHRHKFIASLVWMIAGVKPKSMLKTTWAKYTKVREHYTAADIDSKTKKVHEWLGAITPQWTVDLGCNTGEFTKLALEVGSSVIAVDADHDAIQQLYLANLGNQRLFPVLASIDDIHNGRGWRGIEHKGLAERLEQSSDLLMMLALIHHLFVAASIHLDEIALFAAKCTRKWLIVELVGPNDDQLQLMCKQFRRNPHSEFNIQQQKSSFINAGFAIIEESRLPNMDRHLLLLRLTHA